MQLVYQKAFLFLNNERKYLFYSFLIFLINREMLYLNLQNNPL